MSLVLASRGALCVFELRPAPHRLPGRSSQQFIALRRRPAPQHAAGAPLSQQISKSITPGRAGLILSIPAQKVSLGSPRVGTIHVQAPTSRTPALQAFLVKFSQQTTRFSHLLAVVCFQGSRRGLDGRVDGVCGTGDYPPPDLPRETSRSRPSPEKSVQFGPDGASFP